MLPPVVLERVRWRFSCRAILAVRQTPAELNDSRKGSAVEVQQNAPHVSYKHVSYLICLARQNRGPIRGHVVCGLVLWAQRELRQCVQLKSRLPGFLAGASEVLCDLSPATVHQRQLLVAALSACKLEDAKLRPLKPLMHRLRCAATLVT